MKLHRERGINQESTWHPAHRIRECRDDRSREPMPGPVKVDEAHFGDRARNMHPNARRERIIGWGAVSKHLPSVAQVGTPGPAAAGNPGGRSFQP